MTTFKFNLSYDGQEINGEHEANSLFEAVEEIKSKLLDNLDVIEIAEEWK